ncbi:hypothetical protein F2Q69_00035888 [Brassica cretica]|uniref:Uncharacterized protein n=1 Tax=Brassica cretica TaxID=69181 RepID=A0A8S9SPE1_BRACR|nr:hypothetical protein F2Q69_00035888 [Brassica cretica]
MASGRKRLRNPAAATHPTYGETFLNRTDPSSSSSGTASAQNHVPESQSQGRSSAQEYVSPTQYELPPYYPQRTTVLDGAFRESSRPTSGKRIRTFVVQQQYNWSVAVNETVKEAFNEKAMARLKNNVADWKEKCRVLGDRSQPLYISDDAAQKGALPSISRLYKTTHQHSDGTFVHHEAERIYNDVKTRIQEVQTQLSQQNPEAEPIIPKKRGRMVGISTVNDVPRARAEYAARMKDDSQLTCPEGKS